MTITTLLVDDDEYIINSLKRLFRRETNFTVKTAKNGTEAIKIIEEEKIAVLITDNLMPGISGIDLLVKTKTISPSTIGILMTAYANLITAVDGINRGEIFKFIIKPWDDNILINTVNKAAKRHHMLNSLYRTRQDIGLIKNNLLNNLAHEFSTPMASIIGLIELMLETSLTYEQRNLIDIMFNAADAQMLVIDDLLNFLEIKSANISLDNINFNLKEIIEKQVEMLSKAAKAKGLKINNLIEKKIPDILTGDPVMLSTIFNKIVGNAIKFTNKGEITIYICSEKNNQSSDWLRFEVKDTGIGISINDETDIFQPFTQKDSSDTRKYGGLGLGLTIAKEFVGFMNGHIGFESKKESGTTFWFTIPFKIATRLN